MKRISIRKRGRYLPAVFALAVRSRLPGRCLQRLSCSVSQLVCLSFIVALVGCDVGTNEAVIAGDSMFPSLIGEHYEVRCVDCRFNFQASADRPPASGMFVCPNCGFPENPFSKRPLQPPRRVKIKATRAFNRWDVVAFQADHTTPSGRDHVARNLVKRVVGLPGERVEIVGGNVVINGMIASKPIPIRKRLSQVVNDSAFVSQSATDCRWIPEDKQSCWQNHSQGKYRFAAVTPLAEPQWLVYQPRRCYRHNNPSNMAAHFSGTPLGGPKTGTSGSVSLQSRPVQRAIPPERVEIEDSCGFNQNLARSLNAVSDISVTVDFQQKPTADLSIEMTFTNGSLRFSLSTVVPTLARAEIDGSVAEIAWPNELGERIDSLTLTHCDGQINVLVGDTVHYETAAVNAFGQPFVGPVSLQLGASRGKADIARLRVERDVYYESAATGKVAGGVNGTFSYWQLGPNEFFLLGDNSPASQDSRTLGPISRTAISGIVIE